MKFQRASLSGRGHILKLLLNQLQLFLGVLNFVAIVNGNVSTESCKAN